jgi:glutamyl/glutaminyl-tRNA synthetase
MDKYRVRFETSPTGELHVSNARSATLELCRKDPKNARRRKNVRTNNARIRNSEK